MRHEIRMIDSAIPRLVPKMPLFTSVYGQIDEIFEGMGAIDETAREKWSRMRSLTGEYLGNLYKHTICKTTFCNLEIEVRPASVHITFAHDGEWYDQLHLVKSIENSLRVLGASIEDQILGAGVLKGFTLNIPFKATES